MWLGGEEEKRRVVVGRLGDVGVLLVVRCELFETKRIRPDLYNQKL